VPLAYMPPKLESPRGAGARLQPVTRAQSDDAPAAVRIPTPDELGLGAAKIVAGDELLDWSMVERKLDAAGVSTFQMDKSAGGFVFTCKAPSGAVAGRGATRAAAVRQALAQLGK
jgi:hypothetical protein